MFGCTFLAAALAVDHLGCFPVLRKAWGCVAVPCTTTKCMHEDLGGFCFAFCCHFRLLCLWFEAAEVYFRGLFLYLWLVVGAPGQWWVPMPTCGWRRPPGHVLAASARGSPGHPNTPRGFSRSWDVAVMALPLPRALQELSGT